MSNPSITADKTPWYQWDTGLTVTVSGGEMNECHFANRKQGTAYVQAVINGVARVPDELLQVAAPIKAYGYVSDGAGGQTYVEQTFEVIARNIPADYTYTKTAQKTIRDAEVARDQAVQAAKDAKASEMAADDSAIEASTSAQSAGESASAAATSASNAAKSAGDAAKSASDAKAAAGKAVDDASDLLKTYTDNAKTSADNAATSASNAADAASAASGSASAAEQSATDANSAKVAAQTAKAEAATSASNAAESATAAAKSASDAAASVNAINVISPLRVNANRPAVAVSEFALAIGRDAKADSADGVAIGPNAHAIASAVAIGTGSIANINGTISVGSDNTKRRIMNVASPTYQNDAANKKYTDDNDAKTLTEAKKYTDDNDAKTLTEAKKYTDANTSNALVGTVSGKLLHVEDAWPSKPLGLTIDGAYKQEGTPSPENPVPIVVVENPTLHVAGKNLQKYPFPYYHPTVDNLNGVVVTDNGDGSITATGTPSIESYYNFDFTSDFKFARGADVVVSASSNPSYHVEVITGDSNIPVINSITRLTNKVPTDALKVRSFLVFTAGVNYNVTFFPQFEIGTTATAYAPYTSASLPITLPAEHPYLAALPDGTHDEIVIEKDGNVTLVARVQKVSLNKWVESSGNYYAHNMPSNWVTASGITSIGIAESQSSYDAGKIWFGTAHFIVAYTPRDGDTIESINAIGISGYFSQEPVTYQLGKLDIPSLPETISNVWIEANLTPECAMTYKRDINVAFDNLVQAVVAAAAGE